jgi:hypothetical protein
MSKIKFNNSNNPLLNVIILEGYREINGSPNTHATDLKICAV